MKELFGIAAALLALIGNIPYMRYMFTGRVQPHPYTWLVGSIVSGTVFFGMLTKGAGIGALPVAVSELCTILIFLFSLKFGFKERRQSDLVFLMIALMGLVPWALTKDPTLSVVIAVAVDLFSQVPTFQKTWHHPTTELPVLYGSNVVKHVLLLISLSTYNLATTLHSVAMILSNTSMLGVMFRKRLHNSTIK